MTMLVLINGASGVGKTTVAASYVEGHPMTLLLDMDAVRSMLGGWADDIDLSGSHARVLALALATAHLAAGLDVVVPQLLTRPTFVLQLEAAALAVGARFVEVLLDAPPEVSALRFAERSAARAAAGEIDVQGAILATRGGLAILPQHYAALVAQVSTRAAIRIDARGDPAEVLAGLVRSLGFSAAR